ncbi:MAG: hypothetical protein JXC33_00905 [Deltaproteobacteria bacterium]|nr:hypothetical protein [Deltaproteobacteria bacterium]
MEAGGVNLNSARSLLRFVPILRFADGEHISMSAVLKNKFPQITVHCFVA